MTEDEKIEYLNKFIIPNEYKLVKILIPDAPAIKYKLTFGGVFGKIYFSNLEDVEEHFELKSFSKNIHPYFISGVDYKSSKYPVYGKEYFLHDNVFNFVLFGNFIKKFDSFKKIKKYINNKSFW